MNIKITKYEKIGINKYRIYLENGEVIDTYDNVIIANELLIKKEIDLNLYNKVTKETSLEEHYLACIKYIDYRLRSIKEIKDYLKKKNLELSDIDLIIDKLIKNKYLDDEYFCKCFINDKLKFTNKGTYQIIDELKKNEIPSSTIDKYFDLMNEEIMIERIEHLINKSKKTTKDSSKLRNKLYNNLVRLGYPIDLVISCLNQKF